MWQLRGCGPYEVFAIWVNPAEVDHRVGDDTKCGRFCREVEEVNSIAAAVQAAKASTTA
jgi:hypothetical protein